jgi:hypothetical protein
MSKSIEMQQKPYFVPTAEYDVAIVGAGPYGLARAAHLSGQGNPSFPEHRPLLERLRSPKAGIAPSWFQWQLEHFPYLFQSMLRNAKDQILRCNI